MDIVSHKSMMKKIAACILILAIITCLFLYSFINSPKTAYTGLTGSGKAVVGEIIKGTTIEQEIPYHAGESGISIQFSTYARQNLGNLKIRIVGMESGFTYLNQTEAVNHLTNNSFTDFKYADGCPEKDETLKIVITSTSNAGHGVTIWNTENDALPDYSLIVNGREENFDLAMRNIIPSSKRNFAWPIYALILICVTLSMIMIFNERMTLKKGFLIVALTLGLIYNFVMTPLSIPDEHYHYHSAFRLSNIFCLQWKNIDMGEAKYFDLHSLSIHVNSGSAYDRIFNEFFSALPESQTAMVPLGGALSYPPMLLPQAIGITIGRLLGANFLITFYLGRIMNLIFFIGCVYFAIKKTPRFKMLFFMVGIMPMALHQAASYSYDAYINGMSVLLLAYLLRAIDGEGIIQFKEILSIAIVGALLAPAKVIYAASLLLMLLIPAKRFPNRKKRILSIGIVVLSAAVLIAVFQLRGILSIPSSNDSGLNWEGGVNYSIADIFKTPGRIAAVCFNSFKTGAWGWFQQSIGRVLSGLTMSIEEAPITIYIILLLLSSFSYEGEKTTTGTERCVFFVAGIIPVFLTMLIMLLSWTSNTHDTILGIQGRYFIPVLPLFYMCLNNRLVTIRRPIEKYIALAGVLTNIYVLQIVLFQTMLS